MSDFILAIDPGNVDSGYVFCNAKTLKPIKFGKVNNYDLLDIITDTFWEYRDYTIDVAMEFIRSYGMSVGQTVFETCFWTGRFYEYIASYRKQRPSFIPRMQRIYRQDEKMCICHSMKANDTTIRQALIDRFAPNEPNYGKGTKKNKGFFYGFKADVWSAMAIATTYHDMYSHVDEVIENGNLQILR